MILYLDSSAIVKRYVEEKGSGIVRDAYARAYRGDTILAFSAWNIGEVLGVFDKYRKRGWLSEESYARALGAFASETSRLIKLGAARLIPVRASILVESWSFVLKYHMYQADALQIVSAKRVKADVFYTGDGELADIAASEGLSVKRLED